jgi:hypothetical protein
VHKSLYAFFDREARAISRNFSQLIHAGMGFVDVPLLHRQQANLRGSPQASLDGVNHVEKLDWLLVSDIAQTHRSP